MIGPVFRPTVAVTHLSPSNDQVLQPILHGDAFIEFRTARSPLPKFPPLNAFSVAPVSLKHCQINPWVNLEAE